jgi:hypothetical protein
LNLMPESTLRWQSFNQKKPYFIATVFSLVLMAFAVGYLFEKLAGVKQKELEKIQASIEPLQRKEQQFKKVYGELKKTQQELEQMAVWMEDRYYWADILKELRAALIRAEDVTKKKLGTDTGVWIEQLISMTPSASAAGDAMGGERAISGAMPPLGRPALPEMEANASRTGPPRGRRRPPGEEASASGAAPASPLGATGASADTIITLQCRGVSLTQVSSSANTDIAYAVENELKASPLFEAKDTQLSPQINVDEASGTFTFGVTLALKRPLKL